MQKSNTSNSLFTATTFVLTVRADVQLLLVVSMAAIIALVPTGQPLRTKQHIRRQLSEPAQCCASTANCSPGHWPPDARNESPHNLVPCLCCRQPVPLAPMCSLRLLDSRRLLHCEQTQQQPQSDHSVGWCSVRRVPYCAPRLRTPLRRVCITSSPMFSTNACVLRLQHRCIHIYEARIILACLELYITVFISVVSIRTKKLVAMHD